MEAAEPTSREHLFRVRLSRFVGFAVGVSALVLWTLHTGDSITGILAAVPVGYLAYRIELAVFQVLDVRILAVLGWE